MASPDSFNFKHYPNKKIILFTKGIYILLHNQNIYCPSTYSLSLSLSLTNTHIYTCTQYIIFTVLKFSSYIYIYASDKTIPIHTCTHSRMHAQTHTHTHMQCSDSKLCQHLQVLSGHLKWFTCCTQLKLLLWSHRQSSHPTECVNCNNNNNNNSYSYIALYPVKIYELV